MQSPITISIYPKRAAAAHGYRLPRFALVGASGMAVNTAVLALLVETAGLHHLLAATLATEAAILSNFALNDCWTFGDARSRASWPRRAWRYNLVAAGGLLISVAVLGVLTYRVGLHYAIANLFGIGAGFVWNYAVNARVTWAVVAPESLPGSGLRPGSEIRQAIGDRIAPAANREP